MEAVLEYILKSAGVLSTFVLIYHFLLRRLTFFNTNRWFLLAGIAASILFPLIEITQTVYVEQAE
ncbi:MAG: bla regulator protein BlaR1 [Nonlabens sp.]|jgi:bla regulator protein BlaR1